MQRVLSWTSGELRIGYLQKKSKDIFTLSDKLSIFHLNRQLCERKRNLDFHRQISCTSMTIVTPAFAAKTSVWSSTAQKESIIFDLDIGKGTTTKTQQQTQNSSEGTAATTDSKTLAKCDKDRNDSEGKPRTRAKQGTSAGKHGEHGEGSTRSLGSLDRRAAAAVKPHCLRSRRVECVGMPPLPLLARLG